MYELEQSGILALVGVRKYIIWRINYHVLLIKLDENGDQKDNCLWKNIENAIHEIFQSKPQVKYN